MASQGSTGSNPAPFNPDKPYLTINELSQRTGYAVQSIRNLMSKKILKLGKHYFRPNGKVLFYWPAIEKWIRGEE
jgi:hypothetical protein